MRKTSLLSTYNLSISDYIFQIGTLRNASNPHAFRARAVDLSQVEFPTLTPVIRPSSTAASKSSGTREPDEAVSKKLPPETTTELLETILNPFINEAQSRRQERARIELDF